MDNRFSNKLNSSRFFKKLLNNKFVNFLLISLLIFLNLWVITEIAFVFRPVVIAMEIIGPPLIFAMIFFYLLLPVVDWLEKKGLNRTLSIFLVFAIIVLLIVISIYFIIPTIQNQLESLIISFPSYWNQLLEMLEGLINTDAFSNLVNEIQNGDLISNITEQGAGIIFAAIDGIGSVIGTVTQVIITIFTTPIILYYFLIDGKKFPERVLFATPAKWKPAISEFLGKVHNQLGFYVRGQMIVAFFVALMFFGGFTIIGLDYALILGITAGILNLIPYLGSIIAAIPALIIGIVISPFMFIKVILVLAIEQFLEGRVVQPLVLGNQLNFHPITIIFILLVSGRLFGLMGVILGIPVYAIAKIIFSMLFEYLYKYSGLYQGASSQVNLEEPIINRED